MTIEKKNGGYLIYTIKGGQLIQSFFIGYNKKDSIKLFKQHLKKS